MKPSLQDRWDQAKTARRGSLAALALGIASSMGCGAAPEQPHLEAKTREQTPIAVCTQKLSPLRGGRGKAVVRTLEPDQWAEIAFPGFNADKGLNPTDVDCTGHYAFANESLRGGISEKGWPRKLDVEEVDVRSGPNGLRTLWYRVLKFENGDEGGPILLARAVDDRAEIYAIGSFRGPAKSQITPVRLGDDNLVVAEAKRCPDPDDCRKQAHMFLARRGRLIEAAKVDIERVQVLPSVTERGLYARYQLRTDVSYKPNGIQLLEQVKVSIIHYEDPNRDSDRALRKVEFSRFLKVERDALFSSNDPLWERVVGQD
ncbi:hypothetical protein [Polyangium sp. 6x1]|uniref:hypothetical protein n=1 Tax=Polyangium sp. 6x1 TaxID=3042689 RepID=UPI002482F61C|nr:hypothetical protein [Polyangium sp. 6x1]MDI1449962.1 hypothetical protein [Polyangium sp. 6x1]